MLYVFFGTDTIAVRKKAHDFTAGHEANGVRLETITPENYTEGMLTDSAGAASLFGGEQIVVIDTPSGKKEVFDDVLAHVSLLGESPNTFVIIEEKLLAAPKKKFQKAAAECIECIAPKSESFNTFAIAAAYLRRDKKSLWILLTKAWRAGASNEEIIGILFWQLKMLRLAAQTSSPEEAGQKPFSYNKAKGALGKFKEGELEKHAEQLLALYHDGHMGKVDISVGLEKWCLSL